MTAPDQPDPPSGPAPGLLRHFDAGLDLVDRAVSMIVIVCMAVLTTVVSLQVFFRYVLNDSLTWGIDVPRLCFIWVVMLSIPLGLKYGAHTGIEMLIDRLGPSRQRALHRASALLMLILMSIVGYYGVRLAQRTWDQMLPGVDISVGFFYVAVVISSIHCIGHILRLAWTGTPPPSTLGEQ